MRILVISDTHGRLEAVYHILGDLGEVDLILHAGDHCRDSDELAYTLEIPTRGVRGNCDFPEEGPLEELLEIEGHKIFMVHGHRHGVKAGVDVIVNKARELGADLAIYGHTHIADHSVVDGVTVFNPGSPVQPRGVDRPSVGIVEINGDVLKAELFYIDYFYP